MKKVVDYTQGVLPPPVDAVLSPQKEPASDSIEQRLLQALKIIEQQQDRINQLQQMLDRYKCLALDAEEHETHKGFFISGPSSTAIVFGRQRIDDLVEALCKINKDQPCNYSYNKVELLLKKPKNVTAA